jgi:hypothetical protein
MRDCPLYLFNLNIYFPKSCAVCNGLAPGKAFHSTAPSTERPSTKVTSYSVLAITASPDSRSPMCRSILYVRAQDPFTRISWRPSWHGKSQHNGARAECAVSMCGGYAVYPIRTNRSKLDNITPRYTCDATGAMLVH